METWYDRKKCRQPEHTVEKVPVPVIRERIEQKHKKYRQRLTYHGQLADNRRLHFNGYGHDKENENAEQYDEIPAYHNDRKPAGDEMKNWKRNKEKNWPVPGGF